VDSYPVGKLPSAALGKFLNKIKVEDEQVLLGSHIGEDAAVIRLGNKLLVAKSDPVTFTTDLIGWYAVHVNANDIATMGVKPRWFLATILLAQESSHEEAESIFDQILWACEGLDVTLVGGHTEITHGFKRPVVVGCMLGEAEEGSTITTSGAQPGDSIVLTKGIAIEGTAILAREAQDVLLSSGLSADLIQRAASYLSSPGISVVKEALTACSRAKVHSMHDPTEGGLSAGLVEIATAARVGIMLEELEVPVLPECKAICEKTGLDPLGLLASGALIITLPCSETAELLASLSQLGVNASIVGRVTDAEDGIRMNTAAGMQDLPQFRRDELARFLDGCGLAS